MPVKPAAGAPRWRRWLLLLILLVACSTALVGGTATYVAVDTTRKAMPPGTTMTEAAKELTKVAEVAVERDPAPEVFGDRNVLNILVLGIDYDYTNRDQPFSKNARSDTIFVLQVRRDGKYVGLLSMPRDMYVAFPNGSHDKVNAAYSIGGVALERSMLHGFLGVNFDHYAVIRIDGATRLIDRLGGIDVTVEKSMTYDDNWGHLHVHLTPGPHHLNGSEAVGYARFRHDEEGDRGRMRRQKVVINAVMQKLTSGRSATESLALLSDMATLTQKSIDTDLKAEQLVALGKVYRQFDPRDLHSAQLDGRDGWVGQMSVIFPPSNAQVDRVTHKVILAEGQSKPPLDVEIFNGSKVPNAAHDLQQKLQAAGYRVVYVTEQYKPTPHNVAVVYSANAQERSKLTNMVGSLKLMEPAEAGGPWGSNPNLADVSIVLGEQ